MKILITGVKGFIGSKIFSALKDNYKIIGIDIVPVKNVETQYYNVDIANFLQLDTFFRNNKDIDVIIHSAALAHRKGGDLSFNRFKKINFLGTKNLVVLSNKYLHLKRFTFFSTISVYGEKLKKAVYREEDELKPKTPYAVTKKMSESYIKNHAQFNYTICRFAPVYSNDFTLNIDRRTLIKKMLYKVGKANCKLSLLNVQNIVIFIEHLLRYHDKGVNQIYNVADSRIYTFQELFEIQKKKSGIQKIIKFPKVIIFGVYVIGKLINNQFLIENSIKLLSDNICDTSKISAMTTLSFNLMDIYP